VQIAAYINLAAGVDVEALAGLAATRFAALVEAAATGADGGGVECAAGYLDEVGAGGYIGIGGQPAREVGGAGEDLEAGGVVFNQGGRRGVERAAIDEDLGGGAGAEIDGGGVEDRAFVDAE